MKEKNTTKTLEPTALRKKTFWQRLKDERYLQIMAWLGLIWMLIFNYAPMYGLLMAFKDKYSLSQARTAPLFSFKFLTLKWASQGGFHHFIEFFKDEEFGNVMLNTLGISILKLIINFPLPILFALLLNEVKNAKFKKTVQTISYLPHFLSWVVLGGILTTWLDKEGFFNQLFVKSGIMREGIPFLASPKYFWTIVIISDLWKELGWGAIIYLAAISGIDQEMYEAAEVDGASRLRQIFEITLPSIAPTIIVMFILAVGGLMGSNFDQIFVLRNSMNAQRANVIDIYTYLRGLSGTPNYAYATAIGLFKSVIAFILLLGANQFTKKVNNTSLF